MGTNPKKRKLSLLKLKPLKILGLLGQNESGERPFQPGLCHQRSGDRGPVSSPAQEGSWTRLHAPTRLSLRPLIPLQGGHPAPCLLHHGERGLLEPLPARDHCQASQEMQAPPLWTRTH